MAPQNRLTYTDIMDDMKEKDVELPKYHMLHIYIGGMRFDLDVSSGANGPVFCVSSPEGALVVQPVVSNSINIKVGKI